RERKIIREASEFVFSRLQLEGARLGCLVGIHGLGVRRIDGRSDAGYLPPGLRINRRGVDDDCMLLGIGSRLTGYDRRNARRTTQQPSDQTMDDVPRHISHHTTYCRLDPCGAAAKAA